LFLSATASTKTTHGRFFSSGAKMILAEISEARLQNKGEGQSVRIIKNVSVTPSSAFGWSLMVGGGGLFPSARLPGYFLRDSAPFFIHWLRPAAMSLCTENNQVKLP